MSVEVMLDLETLGTGNDAAVIQIGAVAFDPFSATPDDWPRFYCNIKFSSACKYGSVDGDTLEWWFKQSEEARVQLFHSPTDLPSALSGFCKWWQTLGKVGGIWSHAPFDAAILGNAFGACRKRPPWLYKQVRDLRTLHSLHWPGHVEREDVPHNALDDARFQAGQASKSIRAITEALAGAGVPATNAQP